MKCHLLLILLDKDLSYELLTWLLARQTQVIPGLDADALFIHKGQTEFNGIAV